MNVHRFKNGNQARRCASCKAHISDQDRVCPGCGESLGAPSYVDFGSAKPGEKLEQQVEIRNWTDKPVRLIGGTSDCSCVTTSTMPLTVPPGEKLSVAIHLKVPSSDAGAFTRTASIWTDCDQMRTINLRLGCRVE